MKKALFGFFIILSFSLFANDGSYYTSGNQLIPINETDISVKKEILQIIRISENEVKIIVDYDFFNPTNEKELIVGFEAPSPSGDVNGYPKEGKHPYIRDFTVLMNGEYLTYKTALVVDSNYVINGSIKSKSINDIVDKNFDENYPNFYYVNYFNATFKKGLNKIKHEYIFKLAGSVETNYSIDYILTAANRWANKQIDDFTLIIDLGDYNDFNINRSFFSGFDGWSQANKLMDGTGFSYEEIKTTPMRILTNDKPVIFKKLNFKPKGELSIYSKRNHQAYDIKEFNYQKQLLDFDLHNFGFMTSTANENSFKILRNYPFARRGYIFKTELIQSYFESLEWYVPNDDYTANFDELTGKEKNWLKELKAKN
jgi:hypothetical protein